MINKNLILLKKPEIYKICILCKKNKIETNYFCKKCFKKDFFIKLTAFKQSIYHKEGLQQHKFFIYPKK
jgi:hypothetical protein